MAGMRQGANVQLKDLPFFFEREPLTFMSDDGAASRGVLYKKTGTKPKVGVHVMHPRTDQSQNYNIPPLVEAGYMVLGRAGRWVNNDIATIHERLLLDVAVGVRELRARGCEQVLLLGNSGGGGLSTLYQSQAAKAPPGRFTDTAAGDPFDLNKFDLPAADGIILIGAHPGEGYCLGKWVDPSMVDENDPLSVDPELDMYNPDNGFRVPPESSRYSAAFLEKFRVAQRARVERMEALAKARVRARQQLQVEVAELSPDRAERARQEIQRQALMRRAQGIDYIAIRRCQADPLYTDLSLDPDDRVVCSFNSDPRPDLHNYRPFISPFVTPEAWMSTWSPLSGRAKTILRLKEISVPLLLVHYSGDACTRMSEARAMFDASAAQDKEFYLVKGTDHYGYPILGPQDRGERSPEGTDAVLAWMQKRFPAGG